MQRGQSAVIHVCALRHVPEMIERTGALDLVSAINADLLPETPAAIAPERHLKLDMHDIVDVQPGAKPPHSDHVTELLAFVHAWDRATPLLIHCFAGISRSTAAAYITLCAINPGVPEAVIARALRRSSDTAIPNRRFVAHADDVLGREGRMVAALEAMGRNRAALECIPFAVGPLHDDGKPGKADSEAA